MNPLDADTVDPDMIGRLADLMREKGIAQLSIGSLSLHLADAPPPAPAAAAEPEAKPEPEKRSELTGLTPSEEKDWFHSSG